MKSKGFFPAVIVHVDLLAYGTPQSTLSLLSRNENEKFEWSESLGNLKSKDDEEEESISCQKNLVFLK